MIGGHSSETAIRSQIFSHFKHKRAFCKHYLKCFKSQQPPCYSNNKTTKQQQLKCALWHKCYLSNQNITVEKVICIKLPVSGFHL